MRTKNSTARMLEPRDVFLRTNISRLPESFDPKYSSDIDAIAVEFRHVILRSELVDLNGGAEIERVFRVEIELGARWISPEDSKAEKKTAKPATKTTKPSDQLAVIVATFVAEFEVKGDVSRTGLKDFSFKNASSYVWPYWREFLVSQCARMNLPKIVLGNVTRPGNYHALEDENKGKGKYMPKTRRLASVDHGF